MDLRARIEALLFWKQEPMTIQELSKRLSAEAGEVETAVEEIGASLLGHGIALIKNGKEVSLATAPEAHADIEALLTDELSKELGKASIETLSIILFSGDITRGEIEHVRGVNSSHALRHLQMRGLIERFSDPSDERKARYRTTTDTLRHLGVRRIEDIPGYDDAKQKIAAIAANTDDGTI
jgi:segregation and condensation protein B